MRRRLALVPAAVAFAAAAVLGPVALAADTVVPTGVEAWYHTTPEPLGAGPVDPYPPGTLHVGVRAGQEDSRTYLTLDLGAIPDGATLTGGTLTLPVAPNAGTVAAESATMQACFVRQPPPSVSGSTDPPPEIDCTSRADAVYAEGPDPHFTVDLQPFTALTGRFTFGLRTGGLALVATDQATADLETWHVALHGRESSTPISARLSYRLPPPDEDQSALPLPGSDAPSVGAEAPPPVAAPFAVPQPPALAPIIPFTTPEPPPEGTFASTVEARNYLSWILTLPILLLGFVAYFGRALTSDDDLRRSAVSVTASRTS